MFHLRYTHVFISNSAWFLGERRISEQEKPPNDLRRDFADDQKHQAGPTDNAKDNTKTTQLQTKLPSKHKIAPATPLKKLPAAEVCLKKTVRKKSKAHQKSEQPTQKRGVKLSADIWIFSIR